VKREILELIWRLATTGVAGTVYSSTASATSVRGLLAPYRSRLTTHLG
jgi:hypothetical protein